MSVVPRRDRTTPSYAVSPVVSIRFKKLREDAILPRPQTKGAAGMDLHSAVDLELAPGERAVVFCGFAMSMSPNFEAQVRPRSGLALKHGISIVNSPGTIDSDYRGEVGAILINHGNEVFKISKGDRIAQMVINQLPSVWIEEVDELDDTERGIGGLGSTGRR